MMTTSVVIQERRQKSLLLLPTVQRQCELHFRKKGVFILNQYTYHVSNLDITLDLYLNQSKLLFSIREETDPVELRFC